MQNRQEQRENTDLFTEEFTEQASELRTQAQRERLVERAKEVAEMLDRLDGLLRVDREQAISYTDRVQRPAGIGRGRYSFDPRHRRRFWRTDAS